LLLDTEAGAILVGLVVGVGALRLLRDAIRARRTGAR
jgi:hypothetical protein